MSEPFETDDTGLSLRDKIIGLGERSIRKSYYPLLLRKLEEVEESRKHLEEKSAALLNMLEDLEQTRSSLADSEARYRSLVENINDVIFSLSPEGVITFISPVIRSLAGFSPDEVVGRPFQDFVHPEDLTGVMERFEQVLGGKSEPYEFRILGKDGNIRHVQTSVRPLKKEARVVGLTGVMSDITERKSGERELQRSNRFLLTLSRCSETLIHATDENSLLEEMCRVVVETGGFPMAWVGYVDDQRPGIIRPVAQFGDHATEYLRNLSLIGKDSDQGYGPAGRAIRTAQIQVSRDIAREAVSDSWSRQAVKFGFLSSVALPLHIGAGLIGVLTIYAAESDVFGEEELNLLAELSSNLTFGISAVRTRIERMESARKLEKALEETINTIAATIESRDPYTAGHQHRVSLLAVAIGREMHLAESRLVGILRGSEIHDIGKIYIPAEILNRPGYLTEIEFSLIKTHPQVGYEIIKDVDFPWPISEMILQHHERWDGGGYPAGLKGEEILLEAQIIAVADVVEAMMSHRPYRPALGFDAAIEEIHTGSGKAYNPEVAAACIRLLQDGFSF